jgi:phage tail-like protein
MPNDLIAEPLVARIFTIDIDGIVSGMQLTAVSGLELEMDVVTVTVNGPKGMQQHIKTRGGAVKVPDVQITRLAPLHADKDEIWKWFISIRDGGLIPAQRKHGSIVLHDSIYEEIGRFNFFNAWPSKLATDAFSSDSTEAIKETITLSLDRFERIK